jgi:hypothetical protein
MPWLEIHNTYHEAVSIVIMKEDQDGCGEYGNWATHGWFILNSGDTGTVLYTEYDAAYVYVEAPDGKWWGDPNGPEIYVNPYDKFDSCIGIGTSTWDVVQPARVYLGKFLLGTTTANLG